MTGIIESVQQFFSTANQVYQNEVEPRAQALGEAVGTMVGDAVHGGAQSIASDPLGYAQDALALPGEVAVGLADAAIEVGTAVHEAGGIDDVIAGVVQHNQGEVQRIRTEWQERPEGFVEWLLGPEGPKVSDQTAQIPGLQDAFGNLLDAGMGNRWIAGPIGQAFGFEYVPGEDFYTTNESSLQSYAGFHDVYDMAGKPLGMDLEESVMEFEANGTEYRLELWRGSYAGGGAYGGEIALYTRGDGDRGALGTQLEGDIDGYYSAVSGDNQIRMTQTIYNTRTGEEYFTNDGRGADGTDGRHFWNLAIRTDPDINHEELGQRGELTLPEDMPAAERTELANAIRTQLESKDGIENVRISEDGRTISYDWSGTGDR